MRRGGCGQEEHHYVIGGYSNGQRLKTVEAYDPVTNRWTEKAPLLVGKSEPAVGLVKDQIVAAGGYTQFGVTADNEAYDPATDSWTTMEPSPVASSASCCGVIGQLYVAGGYSGGSGAESFRLSNDSWTTQPSMPQPTMGAGSVAAYQSLFCIGGASSDDGTVLNTVQVLYAGIGGGI